MDKMYCYVGDLLGFKNIIKNSKTKARLKRAEEWISFVKFGVERFGLSHHQIVSDTIFAGAEGNEHGLDKLQNFARYILEEGVQKSFPIRGAIAFGDVTWDKFMTYGRAVNNAYNLANKQNWIGTSFEVTTPIHDLWSFERIFVYPAPLKDVDYRMLPVLAWSVPPIESLENLTEIKGLTKRGDKWNWDHVNLIQNTILFSIYLKQVKANRIKRLGKTGRKLSATPKKFAGLFPLEPIEYLLDHYSENSMKIKY